MVPERAAWVQASSRPLVLTATIATILISAIEATIVATVMPQIVGQLGGFDLFSWVFTAYLLTQAVTIPIYGRLADIYGRKRMLLVAITLFLIGSVLCGARRSMIALVLFRVVQGVGAGGLLPIAQTVVGDLYTPAERARIQGYLSSIWAVGSILGPLIGSLLIDVYDLADGVLGQCADRRRRRVHADAVAARGPAASSPPHRLSGLAPDDDRQRRC